MNVETKIRAAIPGAPAIASAFSRLARGNPSEFGADLVELEKHFSIAGTLSQSHCYALALDGMGWPRTNLLVENICGLVVEYAIPRSKIASAVEECAHRGNNGPIVRLANEARGLFTHLSNSGEGGELLLFCLAEMVLGYPQLIAKMHLKTATDVHYHGADGVHASVDGDTGQLCLWWGESKLHKTAASAITDCIASLTPLLLEPASSKAKRARDLTLLRYGIDLDDNALEEAIRAYLDTKNPNYNKLKFGAIGMVGFDHKCYPAHPTKADADEIAGAIMSSMDKWKDRFSEKIGNQNLNNIDFHIFFLPFPSVKEFRDEVRKSVGV